MAACLLLVIVDIIFKVFDTTVWVPVRRNWRAYVTFVGTIPFPIIDCKTERVQCKFLCLYVVVNIANEDKQLQTPADIIPLYARKI
jgi:hypothetical protein